MIFHESAHAAAGWMAGGTPTLLTATELRGDFGSLSPAGFAALGLSGSLINVLFCVLGLWVLGRRSISPELRLNAWFVFAFNGMLISSKMIAESLSGFGDWMTVLGRLPGAMSYRVLVATAGAAALVFMVWRSRVALAQLIPDGTSKDRRAEALRIVLTGTAGASVLVLGAGIAAPEANARAILLGFGLLGPFVPMLFVARAMPQPSASHCGATAMAKWRWIAAAASLWPPCGLASRRGGHCDARRRPTVRNHEMTSSIDHLVVTAGSGAQCRRECNSLCWRRDEGALGGTQPNPPVVFDIPDTKAAVLELTAAAAGTRTVATDGRHRSPVSRVVRTRVREVRSRSIFRNV